MRRALLLLLLALTVAAGEARTGAAPTVVYLVRHGEKAPEPKRDPPLSEAGVARAKALADALRGAGVQAILVSEYQRTRLTAEPLARELSLGPEVVPAGDSMPAHGAAVALSLRTRHAGETVLLVGHTNTLPAIFEALGLSGVKEPCNGEYSRLYVVTLRDGASPSVALLRYGAPDPPDACAD